MNPNEETLMVENEGSELETTQIMDDGWNNRPEVNDFGIRRDLQNEPRTQFALTSNEELITLRHYSYQDDSDEGLMDEMKRNKNWDYACLIETRQRMDWNWKRDSSVASVCGFLTSERIWGERIRIYTSPKGIITAWRIRVFFPLRCISWITIWREKAVNGWLSFTVSIYFT